MFTQEELRNILALIAKAQIVGQDAVVVAVLQQKITGLLQPKVEPKNETKSDKKA